MKKMVLDLEKNPIITSECETCYKFAVMQTSKNYDMWLTNHMDMFVNEIGESYYGNLDVFPLSYYADILEINEKNIYNMSEENIVNYIISQINSKMYVILDLNYNRLFNVQIQEFWLHEVLIYGYDACLEEFILFLLEKGAFKEIRVSFNLIKLAYKEARTYYLKDTRRLFERREKFLGITLLKPKHEYKNINAHYDFINKLISEVRGRVYISSEKTRDAVKEVNYTGLSMMSHLAKIIRSDAQCSLEQIDIFFRKDNLSCLRLCEHHHILYRLMVWFSDDINSGNEKLREIIVDYRMCCEKMKRNVLLFQKYIYSRDRKLLLHVADNLDALFPVEEKLLEEFIYVGTEEYTKMKLMSKQS